MTRIKLARVRAFWLMGITAFILISSLTIIPLGRVGFARGISIRELALSAFIGMIFGAGLGFLQWWAFRRLHPLSPQWILCTSIGFGIAWMFWHQSGYFVTLLLGSSGISLAPPTLYISGVLIAVIITVAQGMAAQRDQYKVRKWVFFSFPAWILAWIVPSTTFSAIIRNLDIDFALWQFEVYVGLMLGLIYSGITSMALPINSEMQEYPAA